MTPPFFGCRAFTFSKKLTSKVAAQSSGATAGTTAMCSALVYGAFCTATTPPVPSVEKSAGLPFSTTHAPPTGEVPKPPDTTRAKASDTSGPGALGAPAPPGGGCARGAGLVVAARAGAADVVGAGAGAAVVVVDGGTGEPSVPAAPRGGRVVDPPRRPIGDEESSALAMATAAPLTSASTTRAVAVRRGVPRRGRVRAWRGGEAWWRGDMATR